MSLPLSGSKTSRLSQQTQEVIYAVSLYIGVAIIMVLANKAVLSAVPNLPLSFLWLQIVVAVAMLITSKYTGLMELPDFDWSMARRLSGLMVLNCIGLSLNTLTLKHVDASVYQIARSLTLPFTVILTPIVIRNTPLSQRYPSKGILLSLALVIGGFVAGTSLDRDNSAAKVSFLGIMFGIASSFTTALQAVVVKRVTSDMKAIDLVYYNQVLSCFGVLFLVWMSGELPGLISILKSMIGLDHGDFFDHSGRRSFIMGVMVTGFFGFLINFAGTLQIKVTSPLTHMISSAVRGVLQTILAVMFFGDAMTNNRMLSIALVIIGSSIYTWIKSMENAR